MPKITEAKMADLQEKLSQAIYYVFKPGSLLERALGIGERRALTGLRKNLNETTIGQAQSYKPDEDIIQILTREFVEERDHYQAIYKGCKGDFVKDELSKLNGFLAAMEQGGLKGLVTALEYYEQAQAYLQTRAYRQTQKPSFQGV